MDRIGVNRIEDGIRRTIAGDTDFIISSGLDGLAGKDITREILELYQVYRINRMISYARKNSSFYSEALDNFREIKSLPELSKLPFTASEDLIHHPYRLLCVSITGVARIFSHFTTGTSGRPKKIFFSEADSDRIIRSMSAITGSVMDGSEISPEGAKVAIYLPNYGRPLSMAEMIAEGARKIGAEPFIGSCEGETEDQVKEILAEKPDIIMGSAFRIWRITQVGRESCDLRPVGVKVVLITSEYLPCAMRNQLESAWGSRVFHHYGMTEPGFAIGIECGAHNGYHYNESDLFFEVVDPVTGNPVEDGIEGELVFTSLAREAMPLIRYRTGDMASITREKCSCGSELLSRIGILTKRIGLTYDTGTGEKIYASMFDDVLHEMPDLIDYRLYLTAENGLICKAEMIGNEPDFAKRLYKKLISVEAIMHALETGKLKDIKIEIAPRATLRRGGRTMKRKIVDQRMGRSD